MTPRQHCRRQAWTVRWAHAHRRVDSRGLPCRRDKRVHAGFPGYPIRRGFPRRAILKCSRSRESEAPRVCIPLSSATMTDREAAARKNNSKVHLGCVKRRKSFLLGSAFAGAGGIKSFSHSHKPRPLFRVVIRGDQVGRLPDDQRLLQRLFRLPLCQALLISLTEILV